MSEAKEKDLILAQIKAFKKPNEIAGLSKYLYDLEHDGYIRVWRNEQSRPITARITEQGATFLENGGYAAMRRKSKSPAARLRPMRKEL